MACSSPSPTLCVPGPLSPGKGSPQRDSGAHGPGAGRPRWRGGMHTVMPHVRGQQLYVLVRQGRAHSQGHLLHLRGEVVHPGPVVDSERLGACAWVGCRRSAQTEADRAPHGASPCVLSRVPHPGLQKPLGHAEPLGPCRDSDVQGPGGRCAREPPLGWLYARKVTSVSQKRLRPPESRGRARGPLLCWEAVVAAVRPVNAAGHFPLSLQADLSHVLWEPHLLPP